MLRGRVRDEGVELIVIDKWVMSAIIDGILLWALRLLRLRAILVVCSILLGRGFSEFLSESRELSLELVDFSSFFLLDLLVSDVSLQLFKLLSLSRELITPFLVHLLFQGHHISLQLFEAPLHIISFFDSLSHFPFNFNHFHPFLG